MVTGNAVPSLSLAELHLCQALVALGVFLHVTYTDSFNSDGVRGLRR